MPITFPYNQFRKTSVFPINIKKYAKQNTASAFAMYHINTTLCNNVEKTRIKLSH
jgi:N-glycosylase/DNA lyase